MAQTLLPLLDLGDANHIGSSRFTDLYKIEGHSFFDSFSDAVLIAVKVPRAAPDNVPLRTMQNQFLNRHELIAAASNYDASMICPFKVVNVLCGNEVVRAYVAPWLKNGNIFNVIQNSPHVNKLRLVKDIAYAVQHVHSKERVVTNLCPENVLVASDGRAMLSDVGMGGLTALDPTGRIRIPKSWPYKAPEELCPQNDVAVGGVVHTTAMDVYSFAMTAYAIYSPADFAALDVKYFIRICENGHGHLQKPVEMGQALWDILQQCMQQDSTLRPDMTAVLQILGSL